MKLGGSMLWGDLEEENGFVCMCIYACIYMRMIIFGLHTL